MSARWRAVWVAVAAMVVLAGCAAAGNEVAGTATGQPGFWLGLWHGAISPITFLMSLFRDDVGIYEVGNSGAWYDFGFMLGVSIAFGSTGRAGAGSSRRRESVRAAGVTMGEWQDRRPPTGSTVVGALYLVAGSHVGLVSADPSVYESFAARGLFEFVRSGWADVVMASPRPWIYALAAGEVALGALLLTGGRAARTGWAGVLAFHALLLLFGWGFWLYAVPAGALLGWLARRDWPRLGRQSLGREPIVPAWSGT